MITNKTSDYSENDTLNLTILMNATWKILQNIENEEFIKNQNTELQKLIADKNRFMQILSHDLRSPFNTLIGFSDLLLERLHKYDTKDIERKVVFINKIANNTYNLLNDLLLWSKSQSGKLPFNPLDIDLTNICFGIADEMQIQAERKKIEIQILPKMQVWVSADYQMIKTVMRNLLSNAIKFTNNKGQIQLDITTSENEVVVCVSDTGIGISKENLDKLWNKANPHTTFGTNDEKGTGLGLLLCKEFVEKHGGKIWVESIEGAGSEFKFSLPVCVN